MKTNNKGEIMIETMLVFPVVLFLMFLILAIFSVMYERFNIQIVANDTAARAAMSYQYIAGDSLDFVTGEVNWDDVRRTNPYRYSFGIATDAINNATIERAIEYANRRLDRTTFSRERGSRNINVVVEDSSFSRRYIEVRISSQYYVPFGEVLGFFGLNGFLEYTAVGYAEALDLSNYINRVDFVAHFTDDFLSQSSFIGMLNSFINLFNVLFG